MSAARHRPASRYRSSHSLRSALPPGGAAPHKCGRARSVERRRRTTQVVVAHWYELSPPNEVSTELTKRVRMTRLTTAKDRRARPRWGILRTRPISQASVFSGTTKHACELLCEFESKRARITALALRAAYGPSTPFHSLTFTTKHASSCALTHIDYT